MIWKRNLLPRTESSIKGYSNPDNDPRGVWASGPCHAKTPNEKDIYPITTPSGRIVMPPIGTSWRFSIEKMAELIDDNRIYFGKDGNNIPRYKRFLTEVQDGFVPTTIWFREEVGDNQEAKGIIKKIYGDDNLTFQTPKPPRLIERCLQIATDKNSIILDSFAGSGTTAHAVLNINKLDGGNRKFILIEMEDYAENITAERVKRVIKGYGDVDGTGGDFNFYELGQPLLINNEYINEDIEMEKIRDYIFFMETRNQIDKKKLSQDNEYFLGEYNNAAYYFYYEKDKVATLNHEFLSKIKTKAETYVIYADINVLSEGELNKYNIVFKKTPRDIARL